MLLYKNKTNNSNTIIIIYKFKFLLSAKKFPIKIIFLKFSL